MSSSPSRLVPSSLRSHAFSAIVFVALAGPTACSETKPDGMTATTPTPTPGPGETPTPSARKLPPPISGGTLLITADGRSAIASDPDRDHIYIVDLGSRTVRSDLALDVGAEPGRAVEDDAGHVHVALRAGGAVVTLDPATGATLARRAICPAPRGLAYDRGAKLLHVACAGGELVSIGALATEPARSLRLERDLRDIVVDGNDLLVSTFRSAELFVVRDGTVTTRVAPERARAAFTGGRIGPMQPNLPNGGGGLGNASPGVAWRMQPVSGGGAILLHQRGLDETVGTEPSAYGSGQTCAGIVETVASKVVTTNANQRVVRSGGALAGAVLGVDFALSPDGQTMAVVAAGHAGTEQQLLFYKTDDATTMTTNPGQPCVPGGSPPKGGEGSADGGAPDAEDPVIEYRPPSGEIIAVAFDNTGNLLVQSRQPATLQILNQRTAPIVLSPDVRNDAGHQMFHNATAGKLACASCHPEGGEDGRVWTFAGLGARRTQSLRGGIMDTAPFHWNGDMTSLEHLMHDVFQGRMSGPKVDRPRLESLGRWLDQVPVVAPSRFADGAAVERGKQLFNSASTACATCHLGKDFTNGATVDVGTGGTFQVPQLHNLALRAPYLHDGCAKTLTERFTKCGASDRHGLTSKLTAAQIDDLVSYLETL